MLPLHSIVILTAAHGERRAMLSGSFRSVVLVTAGSKSSFLGIFVTFAEFVKEFPNFDDFLNGKTTAKLKMIPSRRGIRGIPNEWVVYTIPKILPYIDHT